MLIKKIIPTMLFLTVISGLIYFGIWKRETPYPLQTNWDIYEHITLANIISEGNISLLPSRLSDTFTFNAYSPLFHVLLAMPKVIFKIELLGVYWWLEYLSYLFTIVASFVLAQKVFDNRLLPFITAAVSALTFQSFMVYTPLFLTPQTLAALLTVFAMCLLLSQREVNKFYFSAILISIFLMHYIIGLLGCFLLLIARTIQKFPGLDLKKAIIGATLILAIVAAINYFFNWQLISREEATYFNFTLLPKLRFLLDWYSASLIFFIFGYFAILKNGSHSQRLILLLAIFVLIFSLAPFPYVLKFFVFNHYLGAIILTCGIWFLISGLPRLAQILSLAFIGFAMFITFFINQSVYKEPLYFAGKISHISRLEIETAKWIRGNIEKDAFLLSDPGTSYVLEALSGINSQGGAYMNSSSRKILASINYLNDANQTKNALLEIKDEVTPAKDRTLFVLSGRYFAWQSLPERERNSFFYNIWTPQIVKPEDNLYIDFLISSDQFKLLYRNAEITILEL